MPSILTPPDRQQFEHRLRERRLALRTEIRDALLRASTERYADIAGRLQDAQDQALADLLAEVTCADVERDAGEMRDIEVALQRLAAGTYGECAQCAAKIPRARLDACPTAQHCLACEQAHEQGTHRTSPTPA
jgi:DnaK suppressor protein